LGICGFAFITAVLLFSLMQCGKTDLISLTESIKASEFVSEIELNFENENNEDIKSGVGIVACIINCVGAMPYEEPSAIEIELLQFVREEELLARDVYLAMYALYKIPVFRNISNSETIHTTAIKALLEKYTLADPASDHQAGVFVNSTIQQLYDDLVAQGSVSSDNAMIVGANIEDWDIADLVDHLENNVTNQDIRYILTQLYRGSRNHLRAFHAHLTFRGINYAPQYISQELYNQIVNSGWEVGNGFCLCQFPSTNLQASDEMSAN
ncbi:MAG: DUF2202 domain-containing protein, partial [Bacteroidales bacterium]|nr:DUF2202 domain-containing protein [Bacteroidales bacterium]